MKNAADTEALDAARAARLRYVGDATPGISRRRRGRGFSYTGPDGEPIRDEHTLERIRSLAIPPAWRDVWICPIPNGHLQATGRDARGRKQYRYHPRWREVRDEAKFERVVPFSAALPRIRETATEHLALQGLPREKVLATTVLLLEKSLIRVGNHQYAEENRSYGLTTLRDRHVAVTGSRIRFSFRGKSGQHHEVDVSDRRIARIVKRLRELPGQELFQYVDDEGVRHSVTSDDVNTYLREIAGEEFTAKDFRTWAGTMLAARSLVDVGPFENETEARRNIVEAVAAVAERLGNTPTICRNCYVHPAVIDAYLSGQLGKAMGKVNLDDDDEFERVVVTLLAS